MKEKTLFRSFVGDYPTTRILEFLIEGRAFDYTLTDISEGSEVSWRTLNRMWSNFIKNKIVVITRTIGRVNLYKLNQENPIVRKLIELFDLILTLNIKNIQNKNKVVC
jgi:hypothetical protein